MELNSALLETFRRVEVNIPLLDAIKQIIKYVKFLKDLCIHKRRLKGNEQVSGFHDPKPYIAQKVLLFNFTPSLFLVNFNLNGMFLLLLLMFFPMVQLRLKMKLPEKSSK